MAEHTKLPPLAAPPLPMPPPLPVWADVRLELPALPSTQDFPRPLHAEGIVLGHETVAIPDPTAYSPDDIRLDAPQPPAAAGIDQRSGLS